MSQVQASSSKPVSLIDGVFELAATHLGVKNVSHRSALIALEPFDGRALVHSIYELVRRNYERSGASANKDRSKQNWRWHVPQPQISAHNKSPEVVVERAVAAACIALGRDDWSNQIPVASGLVSGAGDGRRAIDLIKRVAERYFQVIELKIASDTPLYAAIELLSYACAWLLARADRPLRGSALLDADRMDFRVLAPAEFYGRYALDTLEEGLDLGVQALGERLAVALSFGFDVLDPNIKANAMPNAATLLALMDHPRGLHQR